MKILRNITIITVILLIIVTNYLLSKPMIAAIKVSTKQTLLNRIIVIDPGHGGRDNGAEVGSVKEDELNLQVAMALKRIIEQAGGSVVLTRDDDYDLSSPDARNHKKEDLNRRVEMMDDEIVDLFISIHMNKYGSEYVNGGHVFFQVNHSLSDLLAKKVQDQLNDLMNKKKFTAVGNYFILNETNVPGILVECGFLSNTQEREKLQTSEYQTQLAYAIYEGIVAYFRDAILV